MNRKNIERKSIKNFWNAIAVSVIALMFIMSSSAVFANDVGTLVVQPVMSISPSTQTVNVGDTVTVDVYIDPEDYLVAGANLELSSFNPAIITATTPIAVTFTNFFPMPKLQGFGTVDNIAGTISGIYELTTPFVGIGTEGTWLSIEFTAVGLGTSPITMDAVGLPDETGTKIEPITVYNGTVTVGVPSVEWDVTLDFDETGGKKDYVVFGEDPDANDGEPADSYDKPKPPAPMEPYLRAWFDDNLPMPYDKLWHDYRSYPDTEKTWELYVIWKSSNSSLTNITIAWDIGEFTGCEYNSVVLWRYDPFDDEWDFAADMLTESEYTYPPRWFNEQWLDDWFQIIATGGLINNPPYMPGILNPIDGATGVDVNDDLSWTGGDPDPGDTVTYDVYFGTTNPPHIFISNQSSTTCNPGTLAYETKHYWKIVSWDSHGVSSFDSMWSFTTKSDSAPGPGPPGPGPGPDQNNPPIADANGPYIGAIGIPVTFDGSGSSDPDGTIANYTWHFGDGTEGYGEITDHIYAEASNYTVTLLVTDNGGIKRSNLTYAIITGMVNNPPSMPIVTGSKMGQKNIIYNYTAMSTDPDNDTIRYFFDWGDGNNTASDFLASGVVYSTTHTWTDSGVYAVSVYASDINGGVSSGTTEMTVFIDVNTQFIDDVIQGYLLDADNDGIYDIFHNNATGDETTVELQDNGNYLIDSDGDAIWNYEYDPQTCMLASYHSEEEPTDEKEETPWYLLIIVAILVIIFIVVYGAKKLKVKKEVRRRMKENAERDAKKKEAEEQEDKSKDEDAEKEDKEDGSAEEKSEGDKP